MKAFLLAAGLGTRLRPVTDTVPKCLVEVDGVALLDIWLEQLARVGVDEVLVNLHHLSDQVERHVAERPQPVTVRTVFEPTLLGSAGTILQNRDFVAGDEMFLAVNADNLTDFDLQLLVDAHRCSPAIATLALFRAPDPSSCGIVEARGGLVTSFEEKPDYPRGDLANAGLYAFTPEIIDLIQPPLPRDLGHDLLPQLVGRAHALCIGDAYFADIGTPEALARARHDWPRRTALTSAVE
jgi:mannose-1-phosphate guanylyltransferase